MLGRRIIRIGGGVGVGTRPMVCVLFTFCGACWPLAAAHSDPLWVRTCFGCVNGAPGGLVLFDYSRVRLSRDGLLPVPVTRCIQMHTLSPCGGLATPALTCARWCVHLQDNFPGRASGNQ